MGTRADFYVGKGKDAEWIGSIAWDGYEWGERLEKGDPDEIIKALGEDSYRKAVAALLASRNDATTPDMGWPWPWDDSRSTDCAYCFVSGKLEAFSWGCPWGEDDDKEIEWPDFSKYEHSAHAGSNRSGIILV